MPMPIAKKRDIQTMQSKGIYVSTVTASQIIGKSHTCFARWNAAGILEMGKDAKGNNIYFLPDVLRLRDIMQECTMTETVALTGVSKVTLNHWSREANKKNPRFSFNHLIPRYIVCGRKYYAKSDIHAYLQHTLKPQPTTIYNLPGGDEK